MSHMEGIKFQNTDSIGLDRMWVLREALECTQALDFHRVLRSRIVELNEDLNLFVIRDL